MRQRLWLLIAPVALFLLLAISLYLGRDQLTHLTIPAVLGEHTIQNHTAIEVGTNVTDLADAVDDNTGIMDGIILPATTISEYVEAILDVQVGNLSRLECPTLNSTRYAGLKPVDTTPSIEYFFALDLRQCLSLLPTLMGSIFEVMRFLGPGRCALSVVEGNSPDGTYDILKNLEQSTEQLGAKYFLQASKIDPSKGDRIQKLADLRNLALQPLIDHLDQVTDTTTVLFLNDVAICPEDILELVQQRKGLGATMTCAMDWTYVGLDPTFYDVWVARGINGDSFFEIPPDGNWNSAWNLFWNAPETQARFFDMLPFQVFSCWNGAVAFAASTIVDEGLRFRRANKTAGECEQGEPQLFCKDMWAHGLGKIAAIPSINLEYSVDRGQQIKNAKGFVSDNVARYDAANERFDWALEPPEKVKCTPTWSNQYWKAWNESLVRR